MAATEDPSDAPCAPDIGIAIGSAGSGSVTDRPAAASAAVGTPLGYVLEAAFSGVLALPAASGSPESASTSAFVGPCSGAGVSELGSIGPERNGALAAALESSS